ncbi:MAG: hypothetical protein CNE99_01795 [OM182 bacterium MED-G24]|uniref:Uncharacterized protein n=1 Tax=OM182 bacterium MED-G24 TaxID=1986255 RepID=A0A2A5WZK5_9GAMM|nr:MAG: hypothetical protein CNE99_01795 [OM182 bacterium MED-G24]RPG25901.1 MAG: hypothetical protein CBC10_005840 [Gammaproteobacteria bacterium TMED50]
MPSRLSQQEALSFLLTHLVVERQISFEMNQMTPFKLLSLATEAEETANGTDGAIPHEVIEQLAAQLETGQNS